jgi:nitrogen regulatory protein P-II 2
LIPARALLVLESANQHGTHCPPKNWPGQKIAALFYSEFLMQLYPMKQITVIGEEVLRDQMMRKILELGATGCSYSSTQGVGKHGERSNDVFSANFQLKVVCTAKVAEAILGHLSAQYFGRYAVVAWLTDVEVVREAHFIKKTG